MNAKLYLAFSAEALVVRNEIAKVDQEIKANNGQIKKIEAELKTMVGTNTPERTQLIGILDAFLEANDNLEKSKSLLKEQEGVWQKAINLIYLKG